MRKNCLISLSVYVPPRPTVSDSVRFSTSAVEQLLRSYGLMSAVRCISLRCTPVTKLVLSRFCHNRPFNLCVVVPVECKPLLHGLFYLQRVVVKRSSAVELPSVIRGSVGARHRPWQSNMHLCWLKLWACLMVAYTSLNESNLLYSSGAAAQDVRLKLL